MGVGGVCCWWGRDGASLRDGGGAAGPIGKTLARIGVDRSVPGDRPWAVRSGRRGVRKIVEGRALHNRQALGRGTPPMFPGSGYVTFEGESYGMRGDRRDQRLTLWHRSARGLAVTVLAGAPPAVTEKRIGLPRPERSRRARRVTPFAARLTASAVSISVIQGSPGKERFPPSAGAGPGNQRSRIRGRPLPVVLSAIGRSRAFHLSTARENPASSLAPRSICRDGARCCS
jgi:hypothetical protein